MKFLKIKYCNRAPYIMNEIDRLQILTSTEYHILQYINLNSLIY